jgi:multimeric flavodoxin WrbA
VKVLGIMGSPRIRGNTDILLDEALKGAKSRGAQTEKILVSRLHILPCQENDGCAEKGVCTIRDAMDRIYPNLLDADRIIVASPMFFYGLPGQLKSLIDRSQALWARKYILKQNMPAADRRGAFIAIGATKGKNLFDGSILTIKYFFDAINIQYVDELLVRKIDKKGEILEHPDVLHDAFELGKRLVES